MRLICFLTGSRRPIIRTAPAERYWMDASSDRAPYRCLPLSIANSHGWQLLTSETFIASWDGGDSKESIHIVLPDGSSNQLNASSHFGSGVLTFAVDALFRTDPGYDLWVGGPTNEFKDGIQPMTGIVETDWAPYSFTMNWKFTRPNKPIVFERGEPFCMIFPLLRAVIESVNPEVRDLSQDQQLHDEYHAWSKSRDKFNADLKVEGSAARKELWQKHYMRGQTFDGRHVSEHRTRIRLRRFI